MYKQVELLDDSTSDAYATLRHALDSAYHQAARGKGAERHANDLPFHEQPMQKTADLHGLGFITGQVTKKLQEAQGMLLRGQTDAALREIHGAIVYAAGAAVYVNRHNPAPPLPTEKQP